MAIPGLKTGVMLHPDLVVALGAGFRVTRDRGRLFAVPWAGAFAATARPSAILRAPDPKSRAEGYRALVRDLAAARKSTSSRP